MNREILEAMQAHALRLQRDHANGSAVLLPSVTVADLIVTLERAMAVIP